MWVFTLVDGHSVGLDILIMAPVLNSILKTLNILYDFAVPLFLPSLKHYKNESSHYVSTSVFLD